MKVYGGIDLHANNNYPLLLDEQDRVLYRKRLPNVLSVLLAELEPFRSEVVGLVVESTYHWYWLVDGLMGVGYQVHWANTAAIQPYAGLKYTDDPCEAEWLARMLRLGILPEGYIYPKESRPVRDLLRQRSWLVRQHTSHLLHVGNILTRNRGTQARGQQIKALTVAEVRQMFADRQRALAVESSLAVMAVLEEPIVAMEGQVKSRVQQDKPFQLLETVYGIGAILAMTIWLETGDISRLAQAGDYASYCRCVDSQRLSNGKKKGENNRHNGNKYLAWAFVEAAHSAARFYPRVRRYVERKTSQKNQAVALKALAHKLARACYYILRDEVPFEPARLFGA
jgi:transposase